jgi:glutathione synthase/RimK-type ligase-like ATP-grasp enzyme
MDQGSRIVKSELDEREKQAARKIGRHLRRRKIRLAAVDLIDGLVTDLNFTSPGLITQMETVLGENLARVILERLNRRF